MRRFCLFIFKTLYGNLTSSLTIQKENSMAARKTTTKAQAAKTTKTTKSKTAKATSAKAASSPAKKTALARPKTLAKAIANTQFPHKAISDKQSKSEIYNEIVEITQVSRKDVKAVFAAIRNVIERHVKPKGSGELTIPELGIKVRRVMKKATKARVGRNPFTGEEIQIPAKPARKSVKVTALKTLKSIIEEA